MKRIEWVRLRENENVQLLIIKLIEYTIGPIIKIIELKESIHTQIGSKEYKEEDLVNWPELQSHRIFLTQVTMFRNFRYLFTMTFSLQKWMLSQSELKSWNIFQESEKEKDRKRGKKILTTRAKQYDLEWN